MHDRPYAEDSLNEIGAYCDVSVAWYCLHLDYFQVKNASHKSRFVILRQVYMHTYFVLFLILFAGSDNKSLACATCNADFTSSWELIQHCQYVHHISIFIDKQVGEKKMRGRGRGCKEIVQVFIYVTLGHLGAFHIRNF